MEACTAMTDKVHKQGEHIPQHLFVSIIIIKKASLHKWILILCHLACHCYLCRDGCVKCRNVVECAHHRTCTDKSPNTIEKRLNYITVTLKAQKHHPQRIPWLLVAVSNATPIALQRYTGA